MKRTEKILVLAKDMMDAVISKDIGKVQKLLSTNPELVSCKDREDNTPLHMAAYTLNKEITTILLDNKAEINAKNKQGLTALHQASFCTAIIDSAEELDNIPNKASDIINILLERGADVNSKNNFDETALHILSGCPYPSIAGAKQLLNKGIDFDAKNDQNETAKEIAKKNKHSQIENLITQAEFKQKFWNFITKIANKIQTYVDYFNEVFNLNLKIIENKVVNKSLENKMTYTPLSPDSPINSKTISSQKSNELQK